MHSMLLIGVRLHIWHRHRVIHVWWWSRRWWLWICGPWQVWRWRCHVPTLRVVKVVGTHRFPECACHVLVPHATPRVKRPVAAQSDASLLLLLLLLAVGLRCACRRVAVGTVLVVALAGVRRLLLCCRRRCGRQGSTPSGGRSRCRC